MNASFIITGAEILRGIRSDALIQPLSSMLTSRGISTVEVRIIPDTPQELCNTIIALAESSDVIVVTGGLGLTPDDTTHIAIQELETRKSVRTGPPIKNPVGSASGIDLMFDETRVLFFPGVPRETLAMFPAAIKEFPAATSTTVAIAVFGLREVEIAKRIGSLGHRCSFLPKEKEVAVIAPKESEMPIRDLLGRHALEEDSLVTTVGSMLKDRGLTCAAAESCTGGLIGHLITGLAGSSDFFLGSVVSYSNDIKIKILGVKEDIIAGHGAVSEQVARSMLKGVLRVTGADVGIATTGIAGPAGGTQEKPVGTVWIAAGRDRDHIVKDFCFSFDRQGNKMIFAKTALFLLREYIHDQDIYRTTHS
jgi:nicotinamide-nucleotide amidase